jgi:hypothetical protein
MLAFSHFTKSNYRILKAGHFKCLSWAKCYKMKFAFTKYKLIHFTKTQQFNLEASVCLDNTNKQPSLEIKVLGVWLDTKL